MKAFGYNLSPALHIAEAKVIELSSDVRLSPPVLSLDEASNTNIHIS